MKPWREVAVPHKDVLEGTFQQSEFAADITAVSTGQAAREYQDAEAFYQRTFITEGMNLLLQSVAKRLNGKGGDPVIQLQTAFGGGKTHTMLAVYHLATRKGALEDLQGIPALLEQAKLKDVPTAEVAVLDGTAHSPGQPWKHGQQTIHTLWGELAWQLGKGEGYALVKDADTTGTSPGKDVLKTLLAKYAPCVVLVDELVAYVRQFPDGQALSGGSYDSNLSFVQALTEAAKLVPNAIVLASLPESKVEAGSHRGETALHAFEKTFARIQALWKPVGAEEAFEIVRRRLFEPISNLKARDAVCAAFVSAYIAEGSKLPSETQEAHYHDMLVKAYPIHPEVFDRLYQDWSTLDGFQRTRGVLKLMAKVIYKLWKDDNQDLVILPSSLPLYDGDTRNELTCHLPAGWDAVIEKDIDGDRAETTLLENKEPRFGQLGAARRVARTLFLGSAPSASIGQARVRGIDRARVLLGCLQPGQTSSVYSDALGRLSDRLHYLNTSADKTQDGTRYWFDTRANLRREMEDRKGRFSDETEVRTKMAEVLRRLASGLAAFDGTHIFTQHCDVADDGDLRLVFLPPEKFYSNQEKRVAVEEVVAFVRNNGPKPRYRGNRLIFVAADHGSLSRFRDCVRTALAWNSIVEDVKEGRLNIDRLQEQQAKRELTSADEVLPRVARECYKWLLCPHMASPTDRQPDVEAFPMNTGGGTFGAEVDRVCRDNELIIFAWSPIHLRSTLHALYWKPETVAVNSMVFWEDMQRYFYLSRLRSKGVLEQAIVKGAGTKDFFGTAYGKAGDAYEGFKLGDSNVQLDDTLLLIEPQAAQKYAAALAAAAPAPEVGGAPRQPVPAGAPAPIEANPPAGGPVAAGVVKAREFHGAIDISPATAKVNLVDVADEVIALLVRDPRARISVSLEIHAEFPAGAADDIKRAVSANADTLGFKTKSWE